MSFNDDEPILASQAVSGKKPAAILAGKTKVTIFNKTTAPLEESEFKVMPELTGAGSGSDRSGVDLVTVLDVSGSMEGEKLEKMKIAMLFVIQKLSPIDRLSVVTFSEVAHRLCPLRQITENSQGEIENLVNALVAYGGTNIAAGIQMGLDVLNDRRLTSGRPVGIMLMSDGQQNVGGDAAKVPVGKVPIYTFGFGEDHDPIVLTAIANNSMGGTFSHYLNQNNLNIEFSQCLAGLLTVAVQDLKLTVTKVESTIVKVSAGNYPQSKDDAAGSVTVSFGDLYNKEVRKVIVDLLLPPASSPASSTILKITYSYSFDGNFFDASPIFVTVRRTEGGREEGEPERKEVMMEVNRLWTAQMIKESRIMGDDKKLDDALKKLDGALKKLVEAQSLQENMVNDESNSLIRMLKYELQQMSRLMKPQEIYEKQGRPFALSSETSHNRQRFAARGDDPKELRLFATPRMGEYLEQAKSFDKDRGKQLPSVDDDEIQELGDEPLPPMVGGKKPAAIVAGKTKVTIFKKTTAPLEESEFKVMTELTGAGSGSDRSGVDLVTILDVSSSMEGEKLEKMKIAMLFMIKKLSPIDRLSVVTFNRVSHRLCPLRQITENSQGEIENLVNALVANGGTNISAGLQTGLKVLNERRLTSGRIVGIMLMSGGQQNVGGDATRVPVSNVPVYTFGFGADHDPRVLNAIANHSMGGTFSHVSNQNNLSIAFSQCLAGLLTMAVQDLKLTVTKVESTIVKVSAGNYPQSRDDAAGSVTVSFGDLYNKEVRKVIVDLLLPAASSPASSNILNITYTYSSGGKFFDANSIIFTVRRTGGGREEGEPERKEVMMEENRLRTAQMIKESRIMADDKKLDGALEKLVEAQSLQENMVNDESNQLIGMLKSELQQISRLMKPQEIYEKQGRPFALSSETSHNRQRFATRGDDLKELRLFATPRMGEYLEQAQSFDKDRGKPLPSVDDDEIQELGDEPLPPMVGGKKPTAILAGKTKVTIFKKTTAPLEESEFKVMTELTGVGSGSDRSGVDLVTVLDVSSSMEGEKLEKMKIAMLFMIKKLSPIDRLSVVTFNRVSHRLCPLRQITENSQGEIENLVNALVANGGTNISAGLQTGLKVLNERRLTSGRIVGIILMSGGQQNVGGDATGVPVGNVPVYTFGFGADHDPRVLNAIANHSMGGTFSDVGNQNNLSIAFSQCLAGLLTVVVRDLKLTVTKAQSTILKVSTGNYPLSYNDAAGSVTISFGDLYNKEVRKVIVDLLLPPASSPAGSNVLNITYTYSSGGKLFDAIPLIIIVSRTGRTSVEPERKEVMMEENRLRTAQMIKGSRVMADDKNLDDALENLVEAQSLLENVVNDESNPLIGMLKSELQQMSRLMKPQAIYEKHGRPFALSSETSHNCQRFAARGDDPKELRLFATPRMDAYLEQAKSFDEDPRKPLPSVYRDEKELAVDEDEKQERAAEPLPPMVGGLRYYIQNFFNAFFKCCGKICVSDSSPQDG